MLTALSKILICLASGAAIAAMTDLPVPGPVIGMGLLFVHFLQEGHVSQGTSDLFDRLSRHIPMLFIPAGVGAVEKFDLVHSDAVAILLSVAVGTVATLVTTAVVANLMFRSAREVQRHG